MARSTLYCMAVIKCSFRSTRKGMMEFFSITLLSFFKGLICYFLKISSSFAFNSSTSFGTAMIVPSLSMRNNALF